MQIRNRQISRKWLVLVVLLALIPLAGAGLYAFYPSPRSIMEEMWMLRTQLLASLRNDKPDEALASVTRWRSVLKQLPLAATLYRQPLTDANQQQIAGLQTALNDLHSALADASRGDVKDLAVECFEAHRRCENLFRAEPTGDRAAMGHGGHGGGHGGHRQAGGSHGGSHGGHKHGLLEIPEGEPVPTVKISVLKDPKKGWTLRTETTNFEFAPDLASTPHKPGVGHGHLYVNGKKVTRLYGEWYFLGTLQPGKNVIRVTLNSNNHSDYAVDGKVIEDRAIVEIKDNRKLVYFGAAEGQPPAHPHAAGDEN